MTQLWWFVARASGLVAWALLTGTVLAGILIPGRLLARQRPAWFLDLHRWLGGLTLGFVALHLVALVADTYVTFTPWSLLVPFASSWKPLPVALGVIAFWLLAVVEGTSLAMKQLPRRWWRRVHLFSYVAFFLTSLHGTFAGTDATNPAYQTMSLVSLVAVVFSTVFRLLTRRSPRTPIPTGDTHSWRSTPSSGCPRTR
ncbi:MAG: ferric reductase-like transmembrane domain-containing protein [Acidimicrobiales bacterium]